MGDLAVAAVADESGPQQGGGLALCKPRQEVRKPVREVSGWQYPRHTQRLDQRRRKELVPTRLPRLAGAILAKAVDCPFADGIGQHVVENLRPLEREDQR